MKTHTTAMVTEPDDIIAWGMSGGDETIPVIRLGTTYRADVTIQLHSSLTPAEQAAWLRRLAQAAADLAEQIEPSYFGGSNYDCAKCGAMFGISGGPNMTDEDYEASEWYDAEVALHESGACVTQEVTA